MGFLNHLEKAQPEKETPKVNRPIVSEIIIDTPLMLKGKESVASIASVLTSVSI